MERRRLPSFILDRILLDGQPYYVLPTDEPIRCCDLELVAGAADERLGNDLIEWLCRYESRRWLLLVSRFRTVSLAWLPDDLAHAWLRKQGILHPDAVQKLAAESSRHTPLALPRLEFGSGGGTSLPMSLEGQ